MPKQFTQDTAQRPPPPSPHHGLMLAMNTSSVPTWLQIKGRDVFRESLSAIAELYIAQRLMSSFQGT